jgi:hypothetical protein
MHLPAEGRKLNRGTPSARREADHHAPMLGDGHGKGRKHTKRTSGSMAQVGRGKPTGAQSQAHLGQVRRYSLKR